jgi:chemotaxis signal transduction protein
MSTSHLNVNAEAFLSHMRDVQRCEASLRDLNLMWRVIEANAKMNCPEEARTILPMMAATRDGFQRLEKELVRSLVQEKVANVLNEVGTQARHVIDLVVRNLYERTADVGFLATDRVLCDHVAGLQVDRARVETRLRAYRAKYTVYDEILLLDAQGTVLAQIDGEASPVHASCDPLIAQALASDRHVEAFRATDLRPGDDQALVYAHRMLHPVTRQPVGVLCLVFGFASEMQGIFASRACAQGRSLLLLLDGDDRVIASADESWIARGTPVPVNRSPQPSLQCVAGREYLVQTCTATPYQGYPGPAGWQGQVMIPVDVAFRGTQAEALRTLAPEVAEGLLSHARSFCPPLYQILTSADTIRRVVWNGQVMSAGRGRDLLRLKNVLEQISDTGARTDELFAEAIRELYDTVLASKLSSARSRTRLLVDLLDRNLYERSNDCRWWARTPELRQALQEHAPTPEALRQVTAILQAINALYTVYARLVVYDAQGLIVAASHPQLADGRSVLGLRIEADDLQAVLALKDAQAYHAGPFRPSPLYDGRATGLYHAAIRAMDDERRIVGGIGIVFNAEVELEAMLRGVGADGAGGEPTQALYVDRAGRVIASTDPRTPVGSTLALADSVARLPNGGSACDVIEHEGRYALVSASVNAGYREFKTSDGHRDDVIALSFQSLGEVRHSGRDAAQRRHHVLQPAHASRVLGGEEFATFYVGTQLSALPAACVREALPLREVAPVSAGALPGRVGMLARRQEGQVQRYVWVFDLQQLLLGQAPAAHDDDAQVIVVEHGGRQFGLLVQALHGVPEFDRASIVAAPPTPGPALVQRLIKAQAGALLIQVLDPAALWHALGGGSTAPTAQPAPEARVALPA